MVELVSYSEIITLFTNEEYSQIFPLYSDVEWLPSENSVLARIHQKHAELNKRSGDGTD